MQEGIEENNGTPSLIMVDLWNVYLVLIPWKDVEKITENSEPHE